MEIQINQAIEILRQGGIVIFPTDTVYGIGCRIDNVKALKRLFQIRNRPEEKAVLAVVDSVKMAKKYVKVSKEIEKKLIYEYWPGNLTIILPCYPQKVPSIARGGGLTLGIRQTNHSILLKLIKGVGVPLVAPSANFAGGKTSSEFSQIDKNLLKLVDFAINMPTGGSKPSTIIDCTQKPWRLLRQGKIKIQN